MAIAQSSNRSAVSAMQLEDTYTAAETISALHVVRLIDESTCELADPVSYEDAKAVGVALNAVTTGNQVRVLTFGILKDPFFNFPLNEPIFLKANGVISNIEETVGFSTQIGHSLGNGAIFINIREPIEL